MKITKHLLKQLIKEELQNITEAVAPWWQCVNDGKLTAAEVEEWQTHQASWPRELFNALQECLSSDYCEAIPLVNLVLTNPGGLIDRLGRWQVANIAQCLPGAVVEELRRTWETRDIFPPDWMGTPGYGG